MTAAVARLLILVTETDPATPGLREGLTEYDVSPGLLGFVVMFAAVLLCIPLLRSMVSKVRGVHLRAEDQGEGPDGGGPGDVGRGTSGAGEDAGGTQPAA